MAGQAIDARRAFDLKLARSRRRVAFIALLLAGCSARPPEPIQSIELHFGGGEPGAARVSLSLDKAGSFSYLRTLGAEHFDRQPVDRRLHLPADQVADVLGKVQELGLDDLESDKIECCDWPSTSFLVHRNGHTSHVVMVGMPWERGRPKPWLKGWASLCKLLRDAEPGYWTAEAAGCRPVEPF